MSNLQTYCYFKLDFQKVDQHTRGKWLIHGTKRDDEAIYWEKREHDWRVLPYLGPTAQYMREPKARYHFTVRRVNANETQDQKGTFLKAMESADRDIFHGVQKITGFINRKFQQLMVSQMTLTSHVYSPKNGSLCSCYEMIRYGQNYQTALRGNEKINLTFQFKMAILLYKWNWVGSSKDRIW